MAARSAEPVLEKAPQQIVRDTDPFDVVSQSFPWAPGEDRATDPMAEMLRRTQGSFGTAAVRTLVLDFVLKLTLTGLPDQIIARKLDVPPDLVRRWRAEQVLDQRSKLVFDPADHLARELAQLDQMERPCWARVLDSSRGSKAWTSAMQALLRIKRQRQILLQTAGLSDHMKLPARPEPDDARGLRKVGDLRRDIDRILLAGFNAIGIPDDTDIDAAIDELGGVLAGGRPETRDLDTEEERPG